MSEQLQKLASRLQALGREHPEYDTVKDAVSLLSKVDPNDPQARSTAWHALEADINTLTRAGIWTPSKDDEELIQHLRTSLQSIESANPVTPSSNTQQTPQRYSVVTPPPISAPLFPPTAGVMTILPGGLVEVLNYSYFLHLLVTDPERVLPPGKSLLSVMAKPGAMGHDEGDGELPKIKDRVQDVVHRAFWDEAVETLSNPSAAVQLPRLKRLYEDLYEAIKPLIPANHPILLVLTCPLSPTSFPLRSALTHLRELLVCLRSRCAPMRDAQIDALMSNIDEPSSITSLADMARLVVDTVRSILELVELMKEDLSQFVVGSMSEKQLRAVLMAQAAKQEEEVVFSLWRPEKVQELWRRWLEESVHDPSPTGEHQERAWARRLMQALGLAVPVSCPLPIKPMSAEANEGGETEAQPHPANILPPPLFFVCPTLLSYTDRRTRGESSQPEESFMARIWILLRTEIDEQPGSGDTKLANLADEVIRVRRRFVANGDALDSDEEARLRTAVDRTLQPNDPVFALLQKRLLAAIAERLSRPAAIASSPANTAQLPERLQTGREQPGKRPRLGLELGHDATNEAEKSREELLVVKGFEDEVLVKAVGEGLSRLRSSVAWTERVWPDLIKTGSLRSST
ncbi:hypothetical protein EVJ58_g7804 [Rhodofomes roseus]|uniref:Uncharacterized protein n=1 Tax=Rhodofomes roseus TaxID=34475 RepID=A0A4Y9Y255_9APHY|nr:hypothetical protein EVJ58_g7804 [Rhodofomes roseus]